MLPLSGGIMPLISFNIVVLPVPLLPIKATRSPRLISKLILLKRVLPSNDLVRSVTVRTSLPLITDGSSLMFILALSSTGLSTTSILSSIFSRLSARLMDFSRLNCFNLAITSSWCLISRCWFKYSFNFILRRIAFFEA